MAIRKLKPTTPGQRHKIIGSFDNITASEPEKSLVVGKRSTGGRNHRGKMTIGYMGGGHKKRFRFIDFKRTKDVEKQERKNARIASHRIASHRIASQL